MSDERQNKNEQQDSAGRTADQRWISLYESEPGGIARNSRQQSGRIAVERKTIARAEHFSPIFDRLRPFFFVNDKRFVDRAQKLGVVLSGVTRG